MYHGSYMFNRRHMRREESHNGIIRTTLHNNGMRVVYPWVATACYRLRTRMDVAAAKERN
jgi:hypothetical protein